MEKFRISSTTNLHANRDGDVSKYIKDEIAFQKETGFDAIDLNLCSMDFLSDGWQDIIEGMVEDAKEQGMRFEICHLPYIQAGAKLEGEEYERFKTRKLRAIEAAKMIGVNYAVMHPNAPTVPQKTFNRKEQFDSVMEYLSPFAEHAAKLGVNVVVENMRVIHSFVVSHRYGQTPDELCDVADALGIGCCWDFGHANISGIKQSEGLAYVGDRLKVLHINDNFGVGDDHVPPFVGNVDWKDAMHGLSLIGYDGLLNFEIATKRMPDEVRPALAKYLVDSAKILESYIK